MSENKLVQVYNNLEKLLKAKMNALPKGFNQTRFLQNCIAVLQDTPGIQKMDPRSVARTMLQGAFLGLDFFRGECYAIPYNKNIGTKKNPKWIKELKFQPDYKGERKILMKYSVRPIQDVYAKVVRKGDYYEEAIIDGKPSINFKPKPFNNNEIIGAFAVAIFKDGGIMYESMSKEKIEEIRWHYSKVPEGQAWEITPEEMYKKTVLRRLAKSIDKDFDSIEQEKAYEEASPFEFEKEIEEIEPIAMPEPVSEPYTGEVIEPPTKNTHNKKEASSANTKTQPIKQEPTQEPEQAEEPQDSISPKEEQPTLTQGEMINEIREILLKLNNNDKEAAKNMLEEFTTVLGLQVVRTTRAMKNWNIFDVRVLYEKLKSEYEELV